MYVSDENDTDDTDEGQPQKSKSIDPRWEVLNKLKKKINLKKHRDGTS